jgi:phage shock protein C
VSETVKRLYRSRQHRVIAGVCGGIADYFNLDPAIIRILWILFTIAGGAGLLTYIAALFIMENNPDQEVAEEEPRHPSNQRVLWGTILIVIGLVFMFTTFRWFYFPFFHIRWEMVLATILIVIGIVVILFGGAMTTARRESEPGATAEGEKPSDPTSIADVKRLYRNREHRIIFGICGGLGDYFHLDPVLIRLIWLLLSFFSGGAGFLVYLVLVFVIPEEP